MEVELYCEKNKLSTQDVFNYALVIVKETNSIAARVEALNFFVNEARTQLVKKQEYWKSVLNYLIDCMTREKLSPVTSHYFARIYNAIVNRYEFTSEKHLYVQLAQYHLRQYSSADENAAQASSILYCYPFLYNHKFERFVNEIVLPLFSSVNFADQSQTLLTFLDVCTTWPLFTREGELSHASITSLLELAMKQECISNGKFVLKFAQIFEKCQKYFSQEHHAQILKFIDLGMRSSTLSANDEKLLHTFILEFEFTLAVTLHKLLRALCDQFSTREYVLNSFVFFFTTFNTLQLFLRQCSEALKLSIELLHRKFKAKVYFKSLISYSTMSYVRLNAFKTALLQEPFLPFCNLDKNEEFQTFIAIAKCSILCNVDKHASSLQLFTQVHKQHEEDTEEIMISKDALVSIQPIIVPRLIQGIQYYQNVCINV